MAETWTPVEEEQKQKSVEENWHEVVEPPSAPQSMLSKGWDWANTPLEFLQKPVSNINSLAEQSISARHAPFHSQSPIGSFVRGAESAEKETTKMLLESFTTPLGIALAPLAAPKILKMLPIAVRTALGLGIGAGYGIPATREGLKNLNEAETAEDVGKAIAGTGLGVATIAGGAGMAYQPKIAKPPALPKTRAPNFENPVDIIQPFEKPINTYETNLRRLQELNKDKWTEIPEETTAVKSEMKWTEVPEETVVEPVVEKPAKYEGTTYLDYVESELKKPAKLSAQERLSSITEKPAKPNELTSGEMSMYSGISPKQIKAGLEEVSNLLSSRFENFLIKPKNFGINSIDQKLDGKSIYGKLVNTFSENSIETKILNERGLKEFLNEPRTLQETAKFVKENSPEAKVESYGMEGKVSESLKELVDLTHNWHDNLDGGSRRVISQFEDRRDVRVLEDLSLINLEKAKRWVELRDIVEREPKDTSPRATSAYETVSALDTKQPMPEWTTSKSRKNVQRVDVVIPKENARYKELYDREAELTPAEMKEYEKLHEQRIGELWSPDNLHENIPNTLGWSMIQYKTGPKGEKIAVITEAQSRWGQELRERNKMQPTSYEDILHSKQKYVNKIDHPLLHDYNRLILKSAIEQARKEGATHIVLSDAETAMMTEGHDLAARRIDVEGGSGTGISQEQGMRLNYDTILPKIAEELTGSKGEKVSLGEHKNSQNLTGVHTPTDTQGNAIRGTRSNLIFKNADGSPKTDISGVMYSIEKAREKFTTFGKDTPESAKLYSGIDPALIKAGLEKTSEIISAIPKSIGNIIDKGVPLMRSQIDALRAKDSPSHTALANAFDETSNLTRKYSSYQNEMLAVTDKLSQEQQSRLNRHLLDEDKMDLLKTPDADLKVAYDSLRQTYVKMQAEQIAKNQPVWQNGQPRKAISNPTAWFRVVDRSVFDTILNEPNSQRAKDLKADFIKGQVDQGATTEDATASYKKYVNSFSQEQSSSNYGAVRRSEGMYIPDSWVEKDFSRAIERYTRRFAADRAFFDSIENNPKLLQLLGKDRDAWGEPIPDDPTVVPIGGDANVKSILDQIHGSSFMARHPNTQALSRLATTLIIENPVTRGTDLLSTPFKLLGYSPVKEIPGLVKAMSDVTGGLEKAYAQGMAKRNPAYLNELWQPSSFFADKINALSNNWTKYTQSSRLENWARGVAQAGGEYLAQVHKQLALDGNKSSIEFLQKLSPDWKTLSNDEIGSRIGQLVQGRYDYTGNSRWVLDSPLTPFAKLSRYSIEQGNNFVKQVLQPLKKGDPKPLILTLFGGAIGGALISEYRELLNAKASNIPEIKEIFAAEESGNTDKAKLLTYRLMQYLQLTSSAGVFSELGKMGFDVAYKNKPQEYNYPLIELGADVVSNTMDATEAILSDSDSDLFDVATKYLANIAKNNVGMGRIIINNWDEINKSDSKIESDLTRQYRRYRISEGYHVSRQTGGVQENPYENLNVKKFKTTTDEDERLALGDELVEKALEAPNDETFRYKIGQLSPSSIKYAPSEKTNPAEFDRYLDFITKVYGPKARDLFLKKYEDDLLRNKDVNQVVPSVRK